MPITDELRTEITRVMRTLIAARGAGRTICPSEVARTLAPEAWRPLMEAVREVAHEMARAGEVTVTQRGVPLPAEEHWRGAIRLGRGRSVGGPGRA